MPRLVRFTSTEIAMYFADHPPPHFHVLGRDGAAQVIGSSGRIDLREALAWAEQNQPFLQEKWDELSGEQQ